MTLSTTLREREASRLEFGLLAVLVAAAPLTHVVRVDLYGYSISPTLVVLAALTPTALIRAQSSSPAPALTRSLWLTLGLVTVAVIGGTFQGAAISQIASFVLPALAVHLIAHQTTLKPQSMLVLLKLLAGSILVACAWGLFKWQSGEYPWFQFSDHYLSGSGTRNNDALLLALAIAIGTAHTVARRSAGHTLGWSAAVGVLVLALIGSLSRGQSLAAACAVAVVVTLGLPLKRSGSGLARAAALALAIASVLTFAWSRVVASQLEIIERFEGAGSSERVSLGGDAFQYGLSNPLLGVGWDRYTGLSTSGQDAHNTFLDLFANTGVVGVALMAGLLGSAIAAVATMRRQLRTRDLGTTNALLSLCVTGLITTFVVSALFQTYYKGVEFWATYLLILLCIQCTHSSLHERGHVRHDGTDG